MEKKYTVKRGLISLISDRGRRTIKEIADESGLSRETLNNFNKGENIKMETLIIILNKYGRYVDLGDYIHYDDQPVIIPTPFDEDMERNLGITDGAHVDASKALMILRRDYTRLQARFDEQEAQYNQSLKDMKKEYDKDVIEASFNKGMKIIADGQKKIDKKDEEIINLKARILHLESRLRDLGHSTSDYPQAMAQADSEYHANKK